jgi:predicted nucleic-acid-binding protein
MIGLDTNVLVRYIVQDDPEQSGQASAFIEKNCTKENPGVVNLIVLVELVWVLKIAYKYDKKIIENVLQQLLITTELHVQENNSVWRALHEYKKGKADFADYLVGVINREHNGDMTVTFDRKASKINHFYLLSD